MEFWKRQGDDPAGLGSERWWSRVEVNDAVTLDSHHGKPRRTDWKILCLPVAGPSLTSTLWDISYVAMLQMLQPQLFSRNPSDVTSRVTVAPKTPSTPSLQ